MGMASLQTRHRSKLQMIVSLLTCFGFMALQTSLVFAKEMSAAQIEKAFSNLNTVFSQPQALLAEPQHSEALVVIFGGWNSCNGNPNGSNIYKKAAQFGNEQRVLGNQFRFIASCYGKVSSSVYFTTASEPRKVYEGDVDTLVKAIHFEASQINTKIVYLVGHSHGGWLAMQSALKMASSIEIRGLATLDPISRLDCNVTKFAKAYFRSAFDLKPEPGCTRAPQDITSAQYERIAARVGWWKNIFEVDSVFLHSSTIHHSDNTMLDYVVGSIFEIFKPHLRIDADTRGWSEFDHLMSGLQ